MYGQKCKEDNLEHEVWLTEAELLTGVRFTRNAKIGETVADAAFTKDAVTYWVEVDNETMSAKQMREKWIRYGKVDGFILVICHRKARLRRLMKSAERVKKVVLFTRFRWLQSVRIREPWIDWTGERVSL